MIMKTNRKKGKRIAKRIINVVGRPSRRKGKKLARRINRRSRQIIG